MKSLSFKQDLGLKIASLLLSVLLWMHVQSLEGQKQPYTFQAAVRIDNLPENLQLKTRDPKTSVTVWGSPELIEDFQKRRREELVRATVDAGEATDGIASYGVSVGPRSELANVEIRELPSIQLEFEEKVTVTRKVEVIPGGEPPAGFEFGTADVNPTEVQISGPKSLVLNIGSVQAKLNLTGLPSGATYRAKVELIDKEGNLLTEGQVSRLPTEVEITPALSPAKPRRSLLVSPRFVGQPLIGFRVARVTVSPSQVRVQGDRERLATVSVLETEPFNIEGLKLTTRRRMNVVLPPGISIQGARAVEVTVTIEPIPAAAPPTASGSVPPP
ncbi:MAG TPA: CdaR family protein [Fimbriimonadaceae bacterium]|nr:CdaR family protein [Fimbriimonadaceae bacterium]